jgi:DNA-directed RNA polymerase subunit F
MAKPEILQQEPVSIAEVRDMLKAVHKRDGELTFRGGKAEEYVNDAARLSSKKVQELIKKLEELEILRLKDIHYIKLADTLPEGPEHVKVILSGYNVTVTKENLKRIADVIDEYRPAK